MVLRASKHLPLFVLAAAHAPAFGAGFAISDKSVSGLGNAFAGSAALATDASAVYNNPAALTQLEGEHLTLAMHHIGTTARFSDTGSTTTGRQGSTANRAADVPNLYYSRTLGRNLRAGIGVYSPFGLGLKYDSDWKGRYHAVETNLRTVTISPAVAYATDGGLAFGLSMDLHYADAELEQAVDFGTLCVAQAMAGGLDQSTALAACSSQGLEPQQDDGTSRLSGDSWTYGFSLGLHYTFGERTRAGLVYHSGAKHELEGESDFEGVPALFSGTFTDSGAAVGLDLPASVSVGFSHEATGRLTLLAGYMWTGWAAFEELRTDFDNELPDSVNVQNWRNTHRYSVGANYRLAPAWVLRAGLARDESPVPSAQLRSPRVPDTDRTWYTAGFNWTPLEDFSVDFAYAYIDASTTPIDNTDALGHTLKGEYDVTGEYLSLQTSWRF